MLLLTNAVHIGACMRSDIASISFVSEISLFFIKDFHIGAIMTPGFLLECKREVTVFVYIDRKTQYFFFN